MYLSIEVHCIHTHEAKQVIIYVLLESHAICFKVPKTASACLHSLTLLLAQHDLNYVLVSRFVHIF